MGDIATVHGMVISSMPVGEYDKRVLLLTKERGKISAFAKGARRLNSPLMGVTRPLALGWFEVYEGRTAYNIRQAGITDYFNDVTTDLESVYYGYYFAELAEYYGQENLDATDMLNLMYVAFKALANKALDNELVRLIYELRIMATNGEIPDFFTCANCGSEDSIDGFSMSNTGVYCKSCTPYVKDAVKLSQSCVYTLQFIITAKLSKLYTFTVNEDVLVQLRMVIRRLIALNIDKEMKSLQMLELMK